MKQLGLLLLGLAVIAAIFAGSPPQPVRPAPGESPALPSPAAAPTHAGFAAEGIVVARDPSGQFQLDLAVNGAPVRFVVDTGADIVALTEADAQRAGLAVDPGAYRPILRTASGEGYGAPVRIARIEVGQTELRDVPAVIVKDLGTSLLGQSALARLGRVELSGDRMVLEPRS